MSSPVPCPTVDLFGADSSRDNWAEEAAALLDRYALTEAKPWTCERFRAWAAQQGLHLPAEQRRFGAVILSGLRLGWFVRVGYAPARSSNSAPKPLYLGVSQ
ncbi:MULTISPECIES: hypothetical protein [Luteimonas]|uniref:hypothetical protein n=1 Tax=Luteimonas TaxID=83614 RepID=UPI00117FE15B|nr:MULTISPECIES: hypothetical protein [Luteimonas]